MSINGQNPGLKKQEPSRIKFCQEMINHLEKICQESDVQKGEIESVVADAYETIQPVNVKKETII